ENLKLTVKEHVILEEPASSTRTLSSLQHIANDFSFGDLFFNDKPSEVENEKITAKTEVESMVQQASGGEVRQSWVCLYTLENLDIPQQVSKVVDEIVTDAVDWAIQAPLQNRFRDMPEHEKKKKKRYDLPKTPSGSPPHQLPPPPPPAAPSSSKTTTSVKYTAWTTTDTRLGPSVSSILKDLHMDDDMAPDEQLHSSDDEDVESAYIPKYQIEEYHKLLTDSVDESIIRHNVSKPLPLGGPPCQVIIQSNFFFNKDLEYLRHDSKGGRPALSISKMKVAYYPNVSLEQMVTDQMLIEEECKYDIAAMYGISHWWFQRQRFYIDRHTSDGNHRVV
nr:hypothetical protein [Tanacetum cinerariifolium]